MKQNEYREIDRRAKRSSCFVHNHDRQIPDRTVNLHSAFQDPSVCSAEPLNDGGMWCSRAAGIPRLRRWPTQQLKPVLVCVGRVGGQAAPHHLVVVE